MANRKNTKTAEARVLEAMERRYSPRRAVKLGFALVALGIPQMLYGVPPFYLTGLTFLGLGLFSVAVGVGDWLGLIDREQLKKDLRKAAKDIWNGT